MQKAAALETVGGHVPRASSASYAGTEIGFTTLPSTRFSSAPGQVLRIDALHRRAHAHRRRHELHDLALGTLNSSASG
jgi:hypothetical protein